jgi:competence protein ComEA
LCRIDIASGLRINYNCLKLFYQEGRLMNTSWLDRNRHLIFGAIVVATLGAAGIFYLWRPADSGPVEILTVEPTASAVPTLPAPTATPTPGVVRVYVSGAVITSDVYFLPKGSIIKDAIIAAGGFTADADRERINQALELQDQQQIHVPRQGEQNPPPVVQGGISAGSRSGNSVSSPPDAPPGGQINLNTATVEQLDNLPGIGPALAQRIIDYRQKVGGFKRVEEITEVSGIGEAIFAKIKDLITVE